MSSRKKILVLGSTGLIGHQVFNYLKDHSSHELHNISYRKKLQTDTILLDARCETSLVESVANIAPDYIINCIGVLIGSSKKDPENAIFLNAYMPHRLARLADNINAKLIHISTDCIFSGDKGGAYIETDEKDGVGTYAKTKGLGEVVSDKHLTLRTSVVGPELKNDGEELFHWFMSQSGSISGFTNAIWSGVTSIELAKAVKWSIEKNITGLYHITNNASISKNNLLKLFKKYTKKDIGITSIGGKNINKSFVDTRLLLDYEIPSYDQMISEMVDLILKNRTLYSQYKIEDLDE
jgi:dTDP-4-dehydrorhamnose reductase